MLSQIQPHQGKDVSGLLNNSQLQKSNNSPTRNIIVANKGEASYLQNMDIDNDGIVTLDEFNQYCDENSISQEEKTKLFQILMSAKKIDEFSKSNLEDEENENSSQNERIYARRGEEKYNEKMDENKDSKITYEEYMKYASQNKKNENKTQTKNTLADKAKEAYTKKEPEEPEIKIDEKA